MRERRNYLLILGAIVALLVGAVLLAVPGSPAYKKPTLGLDLQGGLEVVLKAVPPKGQTIDPQQMQTAQQVIMPAASTRSASSSPNIAQPGQRQIVIQLAGVHDPAKAAAIIGSTGQLQMFDFETRPRCRRPCRRTSSRRRFRSLYGLLKQVQTTGEQGLAGVVLPLQDRQDEGHDEGQGQEGHEDDRPRIRSCRGRPGRRRAAAAAVRTGRAAGHARC